MIRNYNKPDERRSTLTQTTPNQSPGLLPDVSSDSARAQQAVSTNAARVIETTRRAWLGNATLQIADPAKQGRRPKFPRRPMVANLALVMNFWSTRPL